MRCWTIKLWWPCRMMLCWGMTLIQPSDLPVSLRYLTVTHTSSQSMMWVVAHLIKILPCLIMTIAFDDDEADGADCVTESVTMKASSISMKPDYWVDWLSSIVNEVVNSNSRKPALNSKSLKSNDSKWEWHVLMSERTRSINLTWVFDMMSMSDESTQ